MCVDVFLDFLSFAFKDAFSNLGVFDYVASWSLPASVSGVNGAVHNR